MTTAAAVSLDSQRAQQRIRGLAEEAHDLAVLIRQDEIEAQVHEFHGRFSRAKDKLEHRDRVVDQRYHVLRELLLERQLLPTP